MQEAAQRQDCATAGAASIPRPSSASGFALAEGTCVPTAALWCMGDDGSGLDGPPRWSQLAGRTNAKLVWDWQWPEDPITGEKGGDGIGRCQRSEGEMQFFLPCSWLSRVRVFNQQGRSK